jgi:methyl-accepting chemotaxis protein
MHLTVTSDIAKASSRIDVTMAISAYVSFMQGKERAAEIASASAEQATGLDQINRALSQMAEVTQQNSALVEENAATAQTLEQPSSAMDQQVAFFRLADHADRGTRVTAPTRPQPKRGADLKMVAGSN